MSTAICGSLLGHAAPPFYGRIFGEVRPGVSPPREYRFRVLVAGNFPLYVEDMSRMAEPVQDGGYGDGIIEECRAILESG